MPKSIKEALRATAYNRDMVELLELATAFEAKLDAFWRAHDTSSVANELVRAGVIVPEDLNRSAVFGEIEEAAYVAEDAGRFLWSLQMYISELDTNARPLADDAAPDAVVSGRGAA